MDNNYTHCSYGFQELCTENWFILVWSIPYTTHLIQPLNY